MSTDSTLLTRIAERFGAVEDAPAGASAEALQRLAASIEGPLPEAFVAAWGRHDGLPMDAFRVEDPDFGDLAILSVDDMLGVKEMVRGFEEEGVGEPFEGLKPDGPVRPVYHREGWIPFACIDETDQFLLLDLDPPEGGVRGQVIYADFQELAARAVVAGSFTDFVRRVLES